jgi:hypothetical protein
MLASVPKLFGLTAHRNAEREHAPTAPIAISASADAIDRASPAPFAGEHLPENFVTAYAAGHADPVFAGMRWARSKRTTR